MKALTPWQITATELVLDNRWARVRKDACLLPNGRQIDDYFYWEGGDFAQVFPLTADGQVVLTRQYKHGIKEVVLELPAGLLDEKDADPLASAQRELREETGFTGGEWTYLGELFASPSKSTTRAHAFLARGVQRTHTQELDPQEEIEVVCLPVPEVVARITGGAIRDTHSVAITFLALQALGR